LKQVKDSSPDGFEQLVLPPSCWHEIWGIRGDVQGVARGVDGGVDGIVNQYRLGLDRIYLQAKWWEGLVGQPIIQGFVGALTGAGAAKGIIMITSSLCSTRH